MTQNKCTVAGWWHRAGRRGVALSCGLDVECDYAAGVPPSIVSGKRMTGSRERCAQFGLGRPAPALSRRTKSPAARPVSLGLPLARCAPFAQAYMGSTRPKSHGGSADL